MGKGQNGESEIAKQLDAYFGMEGMEFGEFLRAGLSEYSLGLLDQASKVSPEELARFPSMQTRTGKAKKVLTSSSNDGQIEFNMLFSYELPAPGDEGYDAAILRAKNVSDLSGMKGKKGKKDKDAYKDLPKELSESAKYAQVVFDSDESPSKVYILFTGAFKPTGSGPGPFGGPRQKLVKEMAKAANSVSAYIGKGELPMTLGDKIADFFAASFDSYGRNAAEAAERGLPPGPRYRMGGPGSP